MRIFVTGATGFVGSAIVPELLKAGHQVIGLARSEASAEALRKAGAEAFRGDVENLESLRRGAASSDGVIHAGFIHEFYRYKEVCEIDGRAIEALADGLRGSGRPLLVTSGTAIAAPGRLATELDRPGKEAHHPRIASELAAHAAAAKGVKAMIVRLSPSVHGEGDHHGFVPMLIKLAREKGASAYVGDGGNRWTGINRLDAALLYRLAFERGEAGAIYHAAEDEGVAFREIAKRIADGLSLPLTPKSVAEAADHFGWLSGFAGLDCPVSSQLTREQLAWRPTHSGLLEDLEKGFYFKP